MPPRRRRPSPEDLERKFRELEAFKKDGEKRKKEQEKVQRKQAMQEKQGLSRALQQANRLTNSRQADIARLIRKIEKVEAEQERQSIRKSQTQEKFDEDLRKLREERYNVVLQYEQKLAEVGEARSRLEYFERILQTGEGQDEEEAEADGEVNEQERQEQEMLMAEADRIKARIKQFTGENSRLRKDLEELRKALQIQPQEASQRQKLPSENGPSVPGSVNVPQSGEVSTSAVRSYSAEPRVVTIAQSKMNMVTSGHQSLGTPKSASARAPVGSPVSMASSPTAPTPVRAEAVPGATASALAGVSTAPGSLQWSTASASVLPGTASWPGTTRVVSPTPQAPGSTRVISPSPVARQAVVQSGPPSVTLTPSPAR